MSASGGVLNDAEYETAATYDNEVYMTSLDMLTCSGGAETVVAIAPAPANPPPEAVTPSQRSKVALVIGNSAYRHAMPLENPHNDAEAMTGLLKGIGFEVIGGMDLDKRGTEAKLSEFVDRCAQADVSLFYCSGHGIQVAGENFIVPAGAKVEKVLSIDFELVNVSMVADYMGGEKSGRVALLDACRDNPFTRSLSRALGNRSSQVGSGPAELRAQGGGLLVAYATAPGAVATDGIEM